MLLENSSPLYPLWAIAFVVISLILVPRKEYQYLLPHGFLGVIIVGLFLFLSVHLFKAWSYKDSFPYSILEIPIFILAAWGVSIIIFLWSIPEDSPVWTHYLYIAVWSIVGIFFDQLFHNLKLRPYAPWYRSWMWFFPVFVIFWVNYKIYIMRKKKHYNN